MKLIVTIIISIALIIILTHGFNKFYGDAIQFNQEKDEAKMQNWCQSNPDCKNKNYYKQ